jgi:hypothetical protein
MNPTPQPPGEVPGTHDSPGIDTGPLGSVHLQPPDPGTPALPRKAQSTARSRNISPIGPIRQAPPEPHVQRLLSSLREHLGMMETSLGDHNAQIVQLQAVITDQNAQIGAYKQLINSLEARMQQLETTLASHTKTAISTDVPTPSRQGPAQPQLGLGAAEKEPHQAQPSLGPTLFAPEHIKPPETTATTQKRRAAGSPEHAKKPLKTLRPSPELEPKATYARIAKASAPEKETWKKVEYTKPRKTPKE